LNHRNFPTATMLTDAQFVLGALVGGSGTTTIGCLGGAQVDRFGNINSTWIPPRPFLVGSGGGNDVASTAAENVIVATLTPQRTVADCGYITSPGVHVQALVTDLAVFEKRDGVLQVTALAPGVAFAEVEALCGWNLVAPAGELPVLDAPTADEVGALRRWDPRGWFLRAR
jgi:acyl CoA:acetate/3-ketoacid CoA transferase beta subunit